MAEHTFDVAAFRAQFPAFTSPTKYPDLQLAGYFTMAGCYVYPCDWSMLSGDCLQLALNLMTAHLAFTNAKVIAGNTATGIVTGASIDKVSVSLTAPTTRNAWQAWLATSPYGMQLWALIATKAKPFAIGGLPERQGFRRVGGGFGGPRRW
jgi:hypothetical protein